ncbi:predicted coding region HI1506 [Haemophilus influenzae Rd KW20]|nr:predicted coding region HI1506 [Haemophilus influenzae Rd KW20]
MDKTFCVVVQNRIKEGYRRAGFSFHLGDNSLAAVSESQLAQLKADPRLVVQITETGSQEGGEGLSKELRVVTNRNNFVLIHHQPI